MSSALRLADAVAAPPSDAFELVVRAEWGDVDPVGIVRYGAYPRLLDVADAELFRSAGLEHPRLQADYGILLVRRVLHLEYLVPARYDAVLRVALWVVRAGQSALTFGVAVRDGAGDVTHVIGHVVVVAVDATSLAKSTLPPDLVARVGAVTSLDVAHAPRRPISPTEGSADGSAAGA